MQTIIVPCSLCGTKSRIPAMKQHLQPRCGKCKAPLQVNDFAVPVELTDTSMDAFVKNERLPVLVDFFSPTCGPCQTLAPLLRKYAKTYLGRLVIATVDVSKNPGCSAFYKISGVPALIFFKDGGIVDRITGLPDKSLLESKLEYLSGK